MPMGIMKGAGTSSKPSYPARRPNSAFKDDSAVAGRVRVAIRLRPRNAEEVATDADFADCVELQPELKRLKLRKNNWNTETFQFDEVFTETASQKRVYEVVAKPVVESVLNGYNGTVMAYGQTGTGKTFTLGQLGTKDSADRGIIVRALEDILADMNPALDIVTVSYLQLYLETVQDLLAPDKDNIPIIEDPKSGDVSFPGATMVQVHDHTDFLQLLETGEANRFAANTKLNTESSRSHAILLVYIKKSLREKENDIPLPNKNGSIKLSKELSVSSIRKSKLLIVDLAGSERIDKSGSDGHTLEEAKSINLSLTALGKCINALAENSSHIPARDSKLTRLLRDSFGGTARTSLVVTVGPSSRHRGETASTIMFGQRAMKLENMVKLKEEFDYKSLCRKLESQVDILIAQNENASKLALDTVQDLEKQLEESQQSLIDAERRLSISLEEEVQAERKMYQHELVTISQLHQQKMLEISDKLEAECSENEMLRRELFEVKKSLYEKIYEELQAEKQMHQDELGTISQLHQQEIVEIKHKLEAECSENETLKRKLYETKQSLYEQDEKIHVLEEEIKRYKKECADMEKMYLEEMSEMEQKIHAEHAKSAQQQQKMRALEKSISEQDKKIEAREQTEVVELRKKLEEQIHHQGNLEKKLRALQSDKEEASVLKEKCNKEMEKMRKKLEDEKKHKGMVKDEVNVLKEQILYLSSDINENTDSIQKGNSGKLSIASESPATFPKSIQIRNTISGQRAKIAKLFENVGLPKIVSYLESADKDVRIHAVKVVANLATEELNQVTIVEAGGLSSLLMLLETSEDEIIQRVAAGAIANLAMNEKNQEFIMMQGGVKLLAKTANKAEDPQTLQMVGGALANLCGNDKLQARLRDEGGIKALIGMVRSGHSDVLAQVARGVANFAKCESRGATEGHHKGRSLLIDDGALPWIVANSNNEAISVTRHVELALCHLSSHEANAKDIVSFGAFWELVRISRECSREDIRNLAKRALNTSPTFQMELRRVHFTRG